MKNLFNIKIAIIIAIIVGIIVLVFININSTNVPIIDNTIVPVVTDNILESRSLCYYRSTKTDSSYYDVAWLKLNILDGKISGEFSHLPAETDSKTGFFTGEMGQLDQKSMSREALVLWESKAEGMENTEELLIKWGDGSATVGFGEMIANKEGIYIYKDKSNLYYIEGMDQKDCVSLEEQLYIEKYIRENIITIATDKPVLGGTWYVVSVYVNPKTSIGEVVYEDGHIQSKANFTYSYNIDTKEIKFLKFDIKK